MNKTVLVTIGLIVVIVSSLGALITKASTETAKTVVTVAALRGNTSPVERIRLGARVAVQEEHSVSEGVLRFRVHDPAGSTAQTVPVEYKGTVPDTFKVGRDVILEGRFDGSVFHASQLMTQCPSKYEAPLPSDEVGRYS